MVVRHTWEDIESTQGDVLLRLNNQEQRMGTQGALAAFSQHPRL